MILVRVIAGLLACAMTTAGMRGIAWLASVECPAESNLPVSGAPQTRTGQSMTADAGTPLVRDRPVARWPGRANSDPALAQTDRPARTPAVCFRQVASRTTSSGAR